MSNIISLAQELVGLYDSLSNYSPDSKKKAQARKRKADYENIAGGDMKLSPGVNENTLKAEISSLKNELKSLNINGRQNLIQDSNTSGINIGRDGTGSFNTGPGTSNYVGPGATGNNITTTINQIKAQHWVLFGGGLLAVISLFLPWINSQDFSNIYFLQSSLNRMGYQTVGGPIALILGILTIAFALAPALEHVMKPISLVFGLLIAASGGASYGLTIYDLSQRRAEILQGFSMRSSQIPEPITLISPGAGIIAVTAAGLIIVFGAVILKSKSR